MEYFQFAKCSKSALIINWDNYKTGRSKRTVNYEMACWIKCGNKSLPF